MWPKIMRRDAEAVSFQGGHHCRVHLVLFDDVIMYVEITHSLTTMCFQVWPSIHITSRRDREDGPPNQLSSASTRPTNYSESFYIYKLGPILSNATIF